MKPLLTAFLFLAAASAHAAPEPSILNPSGLPVPRYVSLKSGEVNARVGPGTRYPTKFVYQRQSLPVQITEEFAHWRKITDPEGGNGWVHKNMVEGARTAMIQGKMQMLYAAPDALSRAVLRAEAGVIGQVKACEPDWCELDISGRKGWIRKADIWGVAREEVFKE